MKVLIVNQGNTENYGDIAINETINAFFNEKNIETHNLLYWDVKKVFGKKYDEYPNKIKNILWKKMFLVDKLNYKRIKKEIKDTRYDAVIIGGGELIGNHLGFNSSLVVLSDYFYKKNIPVFLFGVSGDVNMDQFYLDRYKKALRRLSYICVRDKKTKDNIKKKYDLNVDYAPDVVFAHNKFSKHNSNNIKNERNNIVLIPIDFYETIRKNMHLENKNEYIDYLKKTLISKLKKNDSIIITSTAKEDKLFIEELYNNINNDDSINNKVYLEEFSTLNNFEEILMNARLVISARMHGSILALNNGADVFSIPFKEKLIEFGKNYSSPKDAENNEKLVIEGLNKVLDLISNKGE